MNTDSSIIREPQSAKMQALCEMASKNDALREGFLQGIESLLGAPMADMAKPLYTLAEGQRFAVIEGNVGNHRLVCYWPVEVDRIYGPLQGDDQP